MKRVLSLLLLASLTGCDFTTPLSPRGTQPWEPALPGVWEQIGQQVPGARLVVLPLDSHELLAVYPARADDTLYAKAWRCTNISDRVLYQLQWLGSNTGIPSTNRVFQLAAVEIRDQELHVQLVNPDALGAVPRDGRELASLLEQAKNDENLFREVMRFRKTETPSP